jgi:hypothetical protein
MPIGRSSRASSTYGRHPAGTRPTHPDSRMSVNPPMKTPNQIDKSFLPLFFKKEVFFFEKKKQKTFAQCSL